MTSPYHSCKQVSDCTGEFFFIFKDSRQCGIAAFAKDELDLFLSTHKIKTYHFYVQDNHKLKIDIQDTYGVRHQSPQLLIVQHGKVIAHLNHYAITAKNIAHAVKDSI